MFRNIVDFFFPPFGMMVVATLILTGLWIGGWFITSKEESETIISQYRACHVGWNGALTVTCDEKPIKAKFIDDEGLDIGALAFKYKNDAIQCDTRQGVKTKSTRNLCWYASQSKKK
jgi:hypothetical protein